MAATDTKDKTEEKHAQMYWQTSIEKGPIVSVYDGK